MSTYMYKRINMYIYTAYTKNIYIYIQTVYMISRKHIDNMIIVAATMCQNRLSNPVSKGCSDSLTEALEIST